MGRCATVASWRGHEACDVSSEQKKRIASRDARRKCRHEATGRARDGSLARSAGTADNVLARMHVGRTPWRRSGARHIRRGRGHHKGCHCLWAGMLAAGSRNPSQALPLAESRVSITKRQRAIKIKRRKRKNGATQIKDKIQSREGEKNDQGMGTRTKKTRKKTARQRCRVEKGSKSA